MISLKGVEKVYQSDPPRAALSGINLEVPKGEFLAVFGRSGSGKTTLLNMIGALAAPTAGTVSVDGMDINRLSERDRARFRNGKIGFIFQSFHILPDRSAIENVLLPARLASVPVHNGREKAMAALDRVGLADRADSMPSSLSGGQLQRVAVARALLMNPPILLADEPTGNLDLQTSREIIEIFKRLHKEESITFIVVTHDEPIAESADRVVHLENGAIMEESR